MAGTSPPFFTTMPDNTTLQDAGQSAQTEELKRFIAGILREHDKDHTANLAEHCDRMEALVKTAVPDGDLIEHRRYHERLIADAADRKAMWKGVRDNIVKSASWIGVVFVGTALWNAFKSYLPGANL